MSYAAGKTFHLFTFYMLSHLSTSRKKNVETLLLYQHLNLFTECRFFDYLQMVLDLIDVEFMCEYPKIRGKDKELFLKKFNILSIEELKEAFRVTCKDLLDSVSEIVPCVGCRRRYFC